MVTFIGALTVSPTLTVLIYHSHMYRTLRNSKDLRCRPNRGPVLDHVLCQCLGTLLDVPSQWQHSQSWSAASLCSFVRGYVVRHSNVVVCRL